MFGRRKAALGFIFVTLLVDVTGFGVIIPVIPKLLSELMMLELPRLPVMEDGY